MTLVSVVMGVKNAQEKIEKTINSVLEQEGVDVEFIIIDDGSTDKTPLIIKEIAARDHRIKLICRENKGLTVSLIEGCEIATGEFIARQDANDISLPGRLHCQVTTLSAHKEAVFCSTYVRHVTKEGIEALVTEQEGIIHGSVLMKRQAYEMAGGYRKQFYYAQDIDLWKRLEELGTHISIPRVYYESLMFPKSISATRSKEQRRFFSIIKRASESRILKGEDGFWLEKASHLSQMCKDRKIRSEEYADGAYFIGCCLAEQNPSLAMDYFREAVFYNKFHMRARLRLGNEFSK